MSMFLGTAITGGVSDPSEPIVNVAGTRTSRFPAREAGVVFEADGDPAALVALVVLAPLVVLGVLDPLDEAEVNELDELELGTMGWPELLEWL